MVAHRKNLPPGKAYVPSSWFIVLTVMVLIGGAGWLGWLLVDDDSSAGASPAASPASATAPSATTSPQPTTPQPTTPEPTEPSKTKTPAPQKTTPAPTPSAAGRTAIVSVLNNSGIRGAARAFSAKVSQTGWQLGGVGNWTGSIDGNTIYYGPGLQQQAQLLAGDVGISRIRPSVAPMRMDRLTIILSGPQ